MILKKLHSNFFFFMVKMKDIKMRLINNYFLKNFNGEIVKYDEDQILANKDIFLKPV